MKKNYVFEYTKRNPNVDKRKQECQHILNQFPEKIPIICEKDPKCKNLKEIGKTKFLVSNDLSVAQFYFMVRKNLNVEEERSSFYLLANGKYALYGDFLMSNIYQKYKNPEDGFLYILYTSTLIWGNDNKNK